MPDCQILVAAAPLDVEQAHLWLSAAVGAGAVVLFTGQVRDEQGQVDALELEHFPGMAEKQIERIIAQASERWPLSRVIVHHRVGRLAAGQGIVLVGVACGHRQAAFDGASYIMDFLKTQAPFWKKAVSGEQGAWVEARQRDELAADRWHKAEKTT